jgi:hypothetical protein
MIVSHRGNDEIFQSGLIDFVPLVKINRPPSVTVKAVVEDLIRIWQACALRKGHFHLILVSVSHADESIVRPARTAHPFPFLDNLRVRFMNDFAKFGKHLAAPVREVCDQCIDKFGWVKFGRVH